MKTRVVIVGLVLALAVAACGSDSSDTAGADDSDAQAVAASGEFPVTIEAPNGSVEIEERPEKIVALSPTATEILFAVGAGDQVVAVDDQSNHPPEAPTTDLSGYTPNVEAIAGYEPDLVVASDDIDDVVASLEKLDIPVVLQPAAASLDDMYRQIDQLGAATGRTVEAEELADDTRAEIEDLVAAVPELPEAPTYYHELDENLFTVTSSTFIGEVYALAGLENVADRADDEAGGYPQLSPEFVVEQDPDIIFLADTKCCGQSAETLAKRPGWRSMSALQEDHVVELDDDVASRWGPRTVEFLREVVDAVTRFAERSPTGQARAA